MKKIFILFFGMAVLMTSCRGEQGQREESAAADQGEVVIPAMFLIHKETGNQPEKELVEAFNEAYAGTYRVEVEWLIGEEADYREKIKQLNAVDKLPAVITDVSFMPDFYELLIKTGRLLDVTPYLNEDEEWRQSFSQAALDACRGEDGSLYLVPLNTQEYLSGIFYNKEIFKKAGVTEFPQTWEDFWDACEKIQTTGYVPLTLHTIGTAWIPMLYSTAYMGTSEEGMKFMRQQFPQNYDVPVFREMMTVCKQLFGYAVPEAIDGDFNTAADLFYSGQAAMIPNGHWMIVNFYNENLVSGDFAAKVGFAPFPGNIYVGSPEMTGWAISTGYSEEICQGAVEFLKFRTYREAGQSSRKYIEDSEKPLLAEYYEKAGRAERVVPNYQMKWNTIIQDEVFLEELPAYLRGREELDEFIEAVNEAVEEYNREVK